MKKLNIFQKKKKEKTNLVFSYIYLTYLKVK